MGYYSTLSFDIEIKEEIDLKELNKKFQTECLRNKDLDHFSDAIINDADIELDDYYRKVYEENIFALAEFLSKYVCRGTITVEGEDSQDHWRIFFDGKGNWKYQEATLFYDFDVYKEFMDKFSNELPVALKQKIEEWNGARKI